MTAPTATRTVAVPGARLHVELRGDGPPLVLLGGTATAGGLAVLAPRLAGRFTVVTHDRRGLGASTADDPAAAVEVATDADDVAALIADLTGEPVLVAGTSNGAVLGLELVVRHPRRVRALVAHEPPLPHLLPAAERDAFRAAQAGVDSALAAGDPAAATAGLAALTGLARPDGPTPSVAPELVAQRAAWLARVAPALHRHRLDIDAVAASGVQIVVAAGTEGVDLIGRRSAAALAARLGTELVGFPGGHAGFAEHPAAFHARLVEALRP